MSLKNSALLTREADGMLAEVYIIKDEIAELQLKLVQKQNQLDIACKTARFVENQRIETKMREQSEILRQARTKFHNYSKEMLLGSVKANKAELQHYRKKMTEVKKLPALFSRFEQEDTLNMQIFELNVEFDYLEHVLKVVHNVEI